MFDTFFYIRFTSGGIQSALDGVKIVRIYIYIAELAYKCLVSSTLIVYGRVEEKKTLDHSYLFLSALVLCGKCIL